MKKLLHVISLAIISAVASAAVVYDGETYEYTKGKAPSSSAYVLPSNVVNVADERVKVWWNNRDTNDVKDSIVDIALSTAEPKGVEIGIDDIVHTQDEPMILKAGATYTLLPTNDIGEASYQNVAELVVQLADRSALRNFDIYIPNETNIVSAIPLRLTFEDLPEGIKSIYVNKRSVVSKLPAKISVKQPYSKLVIGEIFEYDDGTDWTPVITNMVGQWSGTALRVNLSGINLHSCVSAKLIYPTQTGVQTNEVVTASSLDEDGFFRQSSYRYAFLTSTAIPATDSEGNFELTVIYKTYAGGDSACTFTTNVSILD